MINASCLAGLSMPHNMSVTVVGTGNAYDGEHTNACLLVNEHDFTLLVDCGPSVPKALFSMGLNSNVLDAIYISHTHPDHCLGLTTLLNWMNSRGRLRPLTIFVQEVQQSVLEPLISFASWPEAVLNFTVHFQSIHEVMTIGPWQSRTSDTHHAVANRSLQLTTNNGHRLFYSGDGRLTSLGTELAAESDWVFIECETLNHHISHGSWQEICQLPRKQGSDWLLYHIDPNCRDTLAERIECEPDFRIAIEEEVLTTACTNHQHVDTPKEPECNANAWLSLSMLDTISIDTAKYCPILKSIAEFGIDTAQKAGRIALDWLENREKLTVERKGHQDWVSEADNDVEVFIRHAISARFPEHNLLGEETGGKRTPPCWVVDPIDGTTNYLLGNNDFVVSMAYVDEQGPAIGIIYAPVQQRLFIAVRGESAIEFRCGKPVLLSPRETKTSELVVGLNLNYKPGVAQRYLSHTSKLIEHGHQIRVSGAAAWDLVQVAAGELDGCYIGSVNIWDVLAAQIICQQSGLETAPWFAEENTGDVWAWPIASPLKTMLLKENEKQGA